MNWNISTSSQLDELKSFDWFPCAASPYFWHKIPHYPAITESLSRIHPDLPVVELGEPDRHIKKKGKDPILQKSRYTDGI